MKRLTLAAAIFALALLTFFQFPGHTWLQQDTQIYVPILEHLRDSSVLQNEMLATQPHVRFTLYDETALLLDRITGLDFRRVLEFEQIATRALGIWGLFLCGTAVLGAQAELAALLVAAICSLGISVVGPQVLTVEYEPTPRAFAIPLLLCGVGLTAHRRYLAAGIVGACAFLFHPPTALPFLAVYLVAVLRSGAPEERRRRLRGLVPLAVGVAALLIAARFQVGDGETQAIFGRLADSQEQLQRIRSPYLWISMFPGGLLAHYAILCGVALAAFARVRRKIPAELRLFLLGLPILGILAMPASWLLLEHWKWILVPQLQPMRTLLFVALATQFLTAVAGVAAAARRSFVESAVWLALAFLLPVQPVVTSPMPWGRVALVLGLGLFAAAALRLAQFPALRWAPALPAAAFFAIPAIGGIVNYPMVETPELMDLISWARSTTSKDAVFLFPDAGRAVYPGMFRAEAVRALYVDWKGGGQANFLRGLGAQWWLRWQQTGAGRFRPSDMGKFEALGIPYVVLQARHRLPRAPVFANPAYVVYRLH
jgi:hypothetical protein